jgi:hypothetical protein
MQWQPIENLPSNWAELASAELPTLATVWNDQAQRLRSSGEFKTFMERLCREIAIETGIIERLYTIDCGVTRLLIEQGINESLIPHGATDRPVKQIVSLIQDQEAAIEGLFDFVGVIASIAEKLKQNQSATIQNRYHKVEDFATSLFEIASSRLKDIENEIKSSVQNLVSDAKVFTVFAPADGSKSHYHRYQVVETAKQLGYFANLRPYHAWMQLVVNVESSTTILISFHALGHEYRGLLVCSACAYHRDSTEEGERNISDIQPLTDSLFQFSYADEESNLAERFKQWLDDAIVTGLEYWNKSI